MLLALRPKLFLIAVTLFISGAGFSQPVYPKDYFRPPLDIRLLLSGTFGEIRANHFHSGIDIKTGGVEGSPVYAVADGFVSRIKVSAYGYGKVMYVTHPNGYVSVYGHLNRYNETIGNYVKGEQYKRENFEIELFPKEGELPVKKGEVIAYSGNSGSSGGPHLHYEIRDAGTQKIINPLLFGVDVKDFFKPKITLIKIYPESENARINGAGKAIRYPVEGWGTEHRLSNSPAIRVSGEFSLGIQTYDQQNDTDNKNGPYSIKLFIDSLLVFQYDVETFAFDETRYVNSLIDYEEYIRGGVRMVRTRIDPGNRLDMYESVRNKGVFHFTDTLAHKLRYEVADAAGNISSLAFKIKAEREPILPGGNAKPSVNTQSKAKGFFNYDLPNYFNNGSIIVEAPKGVFYDSFVFTCDSARQLPGTFSKIFKVHNKYTPVHDYITLSVKAYGLAEDLREKALMVKIKDDGNGFTSAGGNFESNGYVTTKIREFGDYSITVDTVPPKVKAVNPESFSKLSLQKEIKITISDELSGIAGYRGMLNGKWVLMEYDAKNNLLIYTIDERLLPGKNTFLLEVRDGKNNRAYYSATLFK